MKFTVDKAQLGKLVEVINKAPTHVGLFTSDQLKLTAKEKFLILEHNGGLGCRLRINSQWSGSPKLWQGCVNKNLFTAFVQAAHLVKSHVGFEFEMISEKNSKVIKIRNGKRKAELAVTEQAGNYGTVVDFKKFSKLSNSEKIRKRVTKALSFASTQMSEQEKNCVFLHGSEAFAASQNSGVQISVSGNKETVAIPLLFGSIWKEFPNGTVSVSQKQILLKIPEGYFVQSLSSIAMKKFPVEKFKNIYRADGKEKSIVFDSSSFLKCIQRCEAYFTGAIDDERFLRLELTPGESEAKIHITVGGSVMTETLKMKKPYQGQQETWELSSDYFLPFVSILEEKIDLTARTAEGNPFLFDQAGIKFFLAKRAK